MRDWPLRALYHVLWGNDQLAYRSWAIIDGPDALERDFWRSRNVEVLDADPEEWVESLATCLADELAPDQ
jgi:hypothetical protein